MRHEEVPEGVLANTLVASEDEGSAGQIKGLLEEVGQPVESVVLEGVVIRASQIKEFHELGGPILNLRLIQVRLVLQFYWNSKDLCIR